MTALTILHLAPANAPVDNGLGLVNAPVKREHPPMPLRTTTIPRWPAAMHRQSAVDPGPLESAPAWGQQ